MAYHTCIRCVLSTVAPGVTLDAEGVCSVCREYGTEQPRYDSYFRSEEELRERVAFAGALTDSSFDCLLLYSGGKDSTYVLYRLVDLGYRILALTFDNGYIPPACFDNIANVCRDSGVEHTTVRIDQSVMNRIFVDSLRHDATVCAGCFRGLTARSTEVAIAERIPVVVTGLSRGQIFTTKVHQLLRGGVPVDAIDARLKEFRRLFHARDDEAGLLLADRSLADRRELNRIEFLDYYRYAAVTKTEIMRLISTRAPFWSKPEHVGGCSTNCMINDVGIHVHLQERGFHNYAIPLAWDVRFGHITREQALDELTSPIDTTKITALMQRIGYIPATSS